MPGCTLSLVIPVYNSEKTIGVLVERLESFLKERYEFDVVLVNDGSHDDSAMVLMDILKRYDNVTVLSLSRNFGQHSAIMAGLRYAKGDYVVTMDDDLQHSVEEIPELVSELQKGYDVAYGVYREKKHSFFKNIGSEANNLMADVIIKKQGWLRFTSFRIIRSYVVREMIKYMGPYPYIDGLILRITGNIGTVPVSHNERKAGRSNYTLKKLTGLWLNGFLNFSITPLRLSTCIGSIFASIGVFAAIAILVKALFFYIPVQGWASLIVATLIFSGAILLSTGIIGEYVGRIFLTLNATPQYVIKEVKTKDSLKVVSLEIENEHAGSDQENGDQFVRAQLIL